MKKYIGTLKRQYYLHMDKSRLLKRKALDTVSRLVFCLFSLLLSREVQEVLSANFDESDIVTNAAKQKAIFITKKISNFKI